MSGDWKTYNSLNQDSPDDLDLKTKENNQGNHHNPINQGSDNVSEWKTYKLGEIAELRKEQIVPNGKEQPYIGLEHIEQQSLRLNGVGSSSTVISNKLKFYNGDILYGKLRPYFRKAYKPKFDGVCSTDIFVIKNKKLVEKGYLFYLVASEEFTNIANSGSSGTRMPRADWKQLEKSEWRLPSLPTQRQIASILSSLDDKIELNLQMNQTLEAMAQAIFKEWFVDFNFPSSESGLAGLKDEQDIKEGSKKSGKSLNPENQGSDNLPKGWRMGNFEELTNVKTGKGLKRTEFKIDGTYPIIGANGELGRTDEYLLDDKLLLTGRVGTLGSIKISYGKKWYSDNVLIMKPYDFFYYTYYVLKGIDMGSLNRGSTQPLVTQTDLKNYPVMVPSQNILNLFEETVYELFEKVFINDLQIQSLTQTRDTLLPKLMSGQLKVSESRFSGLID